MMIYTGYRPNEFLSLQIDKYNAHDGCFIGGGKTDAGTDRCVTISPKIKALVDKYTIGKLSGIIFCDDHGGQIRLERFREGFYTALAKMGIDNAINTTTGMHRYTPYSCRHTFATLMDKVSGSSKSKLELMGHTDEKMLQHYQHPDVSSLKAVTDKL